MSIHPVRQTGGTMVKLLPTPEVDSAGTMPSYASTMPRDGKPETGAVLFHLPKLRRCTDPQQRKRWCCPGAGVGLFGAMGKQASREVDLQIDLNLRALAQLVSHALPHLEKTGLDCSRA